MIEREREERERDRRTEGKRGREREGRRDRWGERGDRKRGGKAHTHTYTEPTHGYQKNT